MKKEIFILFLVILLLFLIQHILNLKWDFMVYVLNAKYLSNNGFYFEWLRPPLIPFLIFVFSLGLSWKLGELLFIVFSTFLFFYAGEKLAYKLKLNPTIFILSFLTPYFLFYAQLTGSELLSLALLMLFLTDLKNSKKAGFILGLMFLTRYTNIIFSVLLLFSRNFKKILTASIIFILTISPWLVFNYVKTGDFAFSIYDSYYHNMICKEIIRELNIINFIFVINITLPFLILGIKKKKFDLKIIVVLLLVLFTYFRLPFQHIRYLFSLTLPLSYFVTLGAEKYKKYLKTTIYITIFLMFIYTLNSINNPTNRILGALSHVNTSCQLNSNFWVHINYLGMPCQPLPTKENLTNAIEKGNKLILFKDVTEPNYVNNKTFLHSFPILYEDDSVIILGNNISCARPKRYELKYQELIPNCIERLS